MSGAGRHGHRAFTEIRGVGRPSHPRALEPSTLLFTVVLAVLGSAIGMQLVTTLGITPNTSIIGVLLAVAVSRVPGRVTGAFRDPHRQNLAQTSISSATFGAANSLLLPIGVPVLVHRPDLVLPMLAGATAAMLVDLAMLYWFFDSRLFPGSAPWPPGIAAAEAIRGVREGGRRAGLLGIGAGIGALGTSGGFGLGLPSVAMSAFGVAFIGSALALGLFGVGLLLRAYSPALIGIDLNAHLVPQGMMVGAGLVALGQAIWVVSRRHASARPAAAPTDAAGSVVALAEPLTRDDATVRRALAGGAALYLLAAVALAGITGLWSAMPLAQLVAWATYAAFACLAAELIVGFSAMQAGWFPAFATALIFLVIAVALGFPPPAAAVLVGFVAAGGPAFADAGYDFKTGWLLRGRGREPAFELEGRRQQLVAALVGFLTALVLVAMLHDAYFRRDLFPPIDRVYAATIAAGVQPDVLVRLSLWSIPGAILQLVGGSRRQLGVLFATGLLILNPGAGWAVLAGLALRLALKRFRRLDDDTLTVFGAGCIAGDAVWSFFASVLRAW